MHQAGKAHGQRRIQTRGHVQHHHQVNAGVNFGVVVGTLGHAPELGDFGQQALQRTAGPQHFKHAGRGALHQTPAEFLPHALRHQRIHLAVGDHALHQLRGLGGDAEVRKTRCKTRQPQNTYRVFAKRAAHMAQDFGFQVSLATVGVNQGLKIRSK